MNQLIRTTIISVLILFLAQGLNAQSSFSALPKPGFEKRIQNAVNAINIYNVKF